MIRASQDFIFSCSASTYVIMPYDSLELPEDECEDDSLIDKRHCILPFPLQNVFDIWTSGRSASR